MTNGDIKTQEELLSSEILGKEMSEKQTTENDDLVIVDSPEIEKYPYRKVVK